ncbi:tripartite tricarboxylate transporter TctB family protein [Halomonas campisalis]|uniref:Tripartite tricarboxylate transporter TctB family protein n=1 Tax=Billgrantia campisalis TaxID=74661 RepID=A0ABS9PC63_9GAMM|nr:tripartite tricarboxylate transporter TctB family protein [Halomonas campisalis]MCG6659365.1 tripartite tricarboxylate transporter TctB family protein [Halomonas campisalis]MDR5863967.1 tripartite tricarboxylate transporter TctB family protein [Halomonas campisalis]
MTMRLKEVGIGLFVLALAFLLLIFLIPEGIPQPSRLREGQLSPRFWPLIATSILVMSGVVLTAMAWFEKGQGTPTESDEDDEPLPFTSAIVGLVVGFVLLSGYYWAMTRLGMVVASAVGIVLLAYAYGERRWQVLIPVALLLPVALYLFFVYVAGIPIPDPLARTVFRALF